MMKKGRWPGRVTRGLRPDSNPLRRRIDRVETLIFGGLLVAAATAAPIAAVQASHVAYADAMRAVRVQQETGHQTTAVLLATPAASANGYTVTSLAPAMARWTTPHGGVRTGDIEVPANSVKGETFTIWTDATGDVTTSPATQSQAAGQGTFAAILAVLLTLVTCFAAAGITRVLVNRRRLAGWAADWAVTAPKWTRQNW
jgi:hypothetical protein